MRKRFLVISLCLLLFAGLAVIPIVRGQVVPPSGGGGGASDDVTNDSTIPGTTVSDALDNLKPAYDNEHSHSNKALLDTYAQTEVDLADSVTKKHTHTNKGLLDTYTQTEVDLADSVTKKHTQNTDTQLDSGTVDVDGSDIVTISNNLMTVDESTSTTTIQGQDSNQVTSLKIQSSGVITGANQYLVIGNPLASFSHPIIEMNNQGYANRIFFRSNNVDRFQIRANNAYWDLFNHSIGSQIYAAYATGDVSFNSDDLYIDHGNGRVGINTATPNTEGALDIQATNADNYVRIKANTSNKPAGLILDTYGVNGTLVFRDNGADKGFVRWAQSDGDIDIVVNGNTGASVDTSGAFGVLNGTRVNEFSIDGTLSGNSDDALPTEKAVKTYVDSKVYTRTRTIFDPDTVQATSDAVPIFTIESDEFPNGITIVSFGIKTNASSTYSVVLEEWTDPTTQANDLETVATSASTEAEDDGTIGNGSGGAAGDCNVGSMLFIDLPADDLDWLQVWFTYTINQS